MGIICIWWDQIDKYWKLHRTIFHVVFSGPTKYHIFHTNVHIKNMEIWSYSHRMPITFSFDIYHIHVHVAKCGYSLSFHHIECMYGIISIGFKFTAFSTYRFILKGSQCVFNVARTHLTRLGSFC